MEVIDTDGVGNPACVCYTGCVVLCVSRRGHTWFCKQALESKIQHGSGESMIGKDQIKNPLETSKRGLTENMGKEMRSSSS